MSTLLLPAYFVLIILQRTITDTGMNKNQKHDNDDENNSELIMIARITKYRLMMLTVKPSNNSVKNQIDDANLN